MAGNQKLSRMDEVKKTLYRQSQAIQDLHQRLGIMETIMSTLLDMPEVRNNVKEVREQDHTRDLLAGVAISKDLYLFPHKNQIVTIVPWAEFFSIESAEDLGKVTKYKFTDGEEVVEITASSENMAKSSLAGILEKKMQGRIDAEVEKIKKEREQQKKEMKQRTSPIITDLKAVK